MAKIYNGKRYAAGYENGISAFTRVALAYLVRMRKLQFGLIPKKDDTNSWLAGYNAAFEIVEKLATGFTPEAIEELSCNCKAHK